MQTVGADRAVKFNAVVAGCLLAVGVGGCSGRPSAVRTEFDPGQMASDALEAYDANQDGLLGGGELDAVPALKKHLALYDQDADGAVSEQELRSRFAEWAESGVAFRRLDARLMLDGRPLPGATITFEPEVYMTDWVKPASAVTDRAGLAKIAVASDDLPPELKARGREIPGVYVGAYKVRIDHPSAKIPETYKSGVALGEETTRDALGPSIEINIQTKR